MLWFNARQTAPTAGRAGVFSFLGFCHFCPDRMLQRIQTLYLSLAFLLACGYAAFPFSTKIFEGAGPGGADSIYRLCAGGVQHSGGGPFETVSTEWLLPSLCAVSALLPLIAVFLYRRRPLQLKLCWMGVFACIGVIIADYFLSEAMGGDGRPGAQPVYLHASYVPLAQFLFLRLAAHRIRKDEALVRSADRIR
jgi:hypothetical protein